MKFEIVVEEYDSVIFPNNKTTTLTIDAKTEDEARGYARRLAKENFTINTVKRVDPPEEDIESNHYGMLSDEGNRHVSDIVNDAHKLNLTDARYLVALGNLQTLYVLYEAFSEATDTDVKERVFEAIKKRVERETGFGEKLVDFIRPLIVPHRRHTF